MTTNQLLVTLTGTINPYLQPRLPLVGMLELFEIGTNGKLITAVFREQISDERRAELAATGGFPPGPAVVDNPVFTYGLEEDPDARGWAVACGCDHHGDHLGCTRRCENDGCGHPVGVEVIAMTEAEADARSGVPLGDTDPVMSVTTGQLAAALMTIPGVHRPALVDLTRILNALRIGVAP